MAAEQKVAEEAGKKAGGGPDQALAETIMEEREVDSDGQAETTVHAFLRDRLFEFNEEMEQALDHFESWVAAQQDDFKTVFNQNGFFGYIGEVFEKELLEAGGGGPLMQAMVGEVHNAVAFCESSCFDLSLFVNDAFRRGVRDACWYVRDATPSLLGDKWQDTMKLAADGGNQFIPALYHLGIPSRQFKPKEFGEKLTQSADAYRKLMGLKRKEVQAEQEQGADAEKQAKIEEDAQKDMMEQDDVKKDSAAMA
jgi:hypothetical protein